jgi:hypothetical protein
METQDDIDKYHAAEVFAGLDSAFKQSATSGLAWLSGYLSARELPAPVTEAIRLAINNNMTDLQNASYSGIIDGRK